MPVWAEARVAALLTPPCTSITEALTWALPLAERALDELESTKTPPAMLDARIPREAQGPAGRRVEDEDRGRAPRVVMVSVPGTKVMA